MKPKRPPMGRPTGIVAGDWCYWPQDALERLGKPQILSHPTGSLVGDFCHVPWGGVSREDLFEALAIADECGAHWSATTIRDELKRRDARGELWT